LVGTLASVKACGNFRRGPDFEILIPRTWGIKPAEVAPGAGTLLLTVSVAFRDAPSCPGDRRRRGSRRETIHMTDSEIKAHIHVLSAAIACIAVEASKTDAVTKALKALAAARPDTKGATEALQSALTAAEKSRHDAAVARMTGGSI
jgi:hypothetical protein